MPSQKRILLTFDVEEFDTPLLHNIDIGESTQMAVAQQGLLRIQSMLNELENPPCTFYTTANYALHFKETIQALAIHHEIASHTFYHSRFDPSDVLRSKQSIEKLIGKEIYGFRMPNMAAFDKDLIHKSGYVYDSSINPTWLPGKYNYLKYGITPFTYHNTLEIPASVVPYIRFPLFWLAFKNLPLGLYLQLCNFTLAQTGFLNLYFHPWEFADLSAYKIPSYIIKPDGEKLVKKLKAFIEYYQEKKGLVFSNTIDFVNKVCP